MTYLEPIATGGELVEADQFFAPVQYGPMNALLDEYARLRTQIEQVAALFQGDARRVVEYFIEGNRSGDGSRYSSLSAEKIFQLPGAVAALNTAFWRRALDLTDFYSIMPQKRRDEWNDQFHKHQTPDFTRENVIATIEALEAARMTFLAERVDGIFRALSGEHVTNSPAAFGKRMIIAYLVNGYGSTNHDRVGYINDLRAVIAKFMGRDEPDAWNASSYVVETARKERRGQWVTIDGGALQLRAYKCGTAHLEVHPDMAWRLNCILHTLYPNAIPSSFREKPKRKPKEHAAILRPLPFAVVNALQSLEPAYRLTKNTGEDSWKRQFMRTNIRNAVQMRYSSLAQGSGRDPVSVEVDRVLTYLGAVKADDGVYQFDYDPKDVLSEVICSGCLPDQKTHQYYPTPEAVARAAIDMADIGDEHACLEPSAGTGGLADYLPKERTTCVELSELHCAVLRAKGYRADCMDFIQWANSAGRFDRVVMNPPFADGRALAHVEAAASLVSDGGRLVAILPASMRGKPVLPGWTAEWSGVFTNEFAGTGVSVAVVALERSEP
jgi:hypothetical protein